MEKLVGKIITTSFERLFLDPNNPRLGQFEGGPGYQKLDELFSAEKQVLLEQLLTKVYDVNALSNTIIGQGWMPIDNIVVWPHPDQPEALIVVEGNTRTLALRRIRGPVIERERKKLQRMEKGGKSRHAEHDIQKQRELVSRLEQIITDTDQLPVVTLAATSVKELQRKLPRVLAVRHITGAKTWGNFAEDLWLLQRYRHLFEEKHSRTTSMHWDGELIKLVADEASQTESSARRKLRAASAFSHFRAEFEERMNAGEELGSDDYYLFENIVRKPFIRDQLCFGEDQLHLPTSSEEVLFEWVFKLPRGKNADENENIIYRHENVLLWDQMKRYDEKNGTTFASRFDVENYKEVPTMREVEAEFMVHKTRKRPQAVIEELLRRLRELPAETLLNEGEFLQLQLKQLHHLSAKYLHMIKAAAA